MRNFIFGAFLMMYLFGCKSEAPKINITESKDIELIEQYIKSHPKDVHLVFLKQKIIALKNAQKPIKIITELPKPIVMKTITEKEAEEYSTLLQKDKIEHSKKTVNVLNQLFNNDPSSKNAILLIQNNSDCNMIMRIQGQHFYNLAVPARSENSIVLYIGDYKLSANLCDLSYVSNKQIKKNMIVALKSTNTASQKK